MAQSYQYLPLPSRRSIRLLTIELDDDEPHGFAITVQLAPLSGPPPFTALSYTWASPRIIDDQSSIDETTREYDISISPHKDVPTGLKSLFRPPSPSPAGANPAPVHHKVKVEENLFDFLRQFSRMCSLSPRLLWIDAICIDQQNLAERASQVGYMGEIFKAATKVLVWQGKWEPAQDVAWVLSDFAPRVATLQSVVGREYFEGRDVEFGDPELIEHFGKRDCERWREVWVAWALFLDSLAWFRRGWTIQETVLKKQDEVTVLIGSRTFSWRSILDFAKLMRDSNWLDQLEYHARARNEPLRRYRVHHMNHRVVMSDEIRSIIIGETHQGYQRQIGSIYGASTPEVLWWSRVFEIMSMLRLKSFGDDRDHVFACIGMATEMLPPGMSNPIVADYTISVEAVFTRITSLYLANMPLLRVLSTVEPSDFRVHKKLPSWVPDFSVSQVIATWMRTATGSTFDAGLTKSVEWPRPMIQGTKLTIHGARLAVVEEWGVNFNSSVFLPTVLQACLISETYMASGEAQPVAVCRTLLGDSCYMDLTSLAFEEKYKPWLENYIVQITTGPLRDDELVINDIANELLNASLSVWHSDRLPSLERILHLQADAATCAVNLARSRFHSDFLIVNHGRLFFATREGYLGLGPRGMQPDDEVWLFAGSKVPFLLRGCSPATEDSPVNDFRLVGECYIRGFMHGEGMTADLRARAGPVTIV